MNPADQIIEYGACECGAGAVAGVTAVTDPESSTGSQVHVWWLYCANPRCYRGFPGGRLIWVGQNPSAEQRVFLRLHEQVGVEESFSFAELQ